MLEGKSSQESWVRGRSEKDWRWEEKKEDFDVKKV